MSALFEGLKVVEATEWVMAPACGAVFAGGGADVVKIEHPQRGDGMRANAKNMAFPDGGFDHFIETVNHSKRSIGLALGTAEGREVFLKLIAQADVFITSFMEKSRQKWRIMPEDLHEINPRLIYATTSGHGPGGPDQNTPGFDITAYWARSGIGHQLANGTDRPPFMPAGGFGDLQGGLTLAGGVAAALYRRSVTGEGMTVDVSLLGLGAWAMLEVLEVQDILGIDAKVGYRPGGQPKNPLVRAYRTADDRWVQLNMMNSDKYWSSFCAAIRAEPLETDPRFSNFASRSENAEELADAIAAAARKLPLAEVLDVLNKAGCPHAPYATPDEVLRDPQLRANNYLRDHPTEPGRFLVTPPLVFDGETLAARDRAPEVGQHTEEVLLELGLTWEEIIDLKTKDVVN